MIRKFKFGNGSSRRPRSGGKKGRARARWRQPLGRGELGIERLEDRRMLAAGDLDLSFGGTGWISGDYGLGRDLKINAVAVQHDGKIVVAGSIFPGSLGTDMIAARFNADGTIDTSFGVDGPDADSLRDGYIRFDFPANPDGAAVANDLVIDGVTGAITIAGHASAGGLAGFAVARLTSSGELDLGFSTDGKVQTFFATGAEARGVALLSNGDIVVAGVVINPSTSGNTGQDFALARYDIESGELETSFGTGGVVMTDFNSTGTSARGDQAFDVVIQNVAGVDKILAVGEAARVASLETDFALARYDLNGALDPEFGVGGKTTQTLQGTVSGNTSSADTVAIDQLGRIVVVGTVGNVNVSPNSHVAVARFDASGIIDLNFNPSGAVAGTLNVNLDLVDLGTGLVIQPDGKYVVGGYGRSGAGTTTSNYAIGLARVLGNGTLDSTFGVGGIVKNPLFANADIDSARNHTLALTPDGKIVAAGYIDLPSTANPDYFVARYQTGLTIVDAGGPYAVNEGDSLILTGAGGSNPGDYTWDLDSDGIFGETGAAAANGDEVGSNPIFSAANLDGLSVETVTLRVDVSGVGLVFDTAAVTINNVAPTLAISGDSNTDEGSVYTLDLSSSDPGADAITSWTINWGDGSGEEEFLGDPSSVTHVYADGNNSYMITATATDDDGSYTVAGGVSVIINNVAPTLTISGASSADEGSVYTLDLSSSDPGTDTITSWTIDWGDGGDVEIVSGDTTSLTHTYADGVNNYTITATAADEDGTYSAGNTLGVTVANVTPTLSISGDGSVDAGATYTLNLASADPGADTIASWAINWGDGSSVETFVGDPSSVTHVYAVGNASYTIAASATDEDGNYSANTLVVDVEQTTSEGVFLVDGVLHVSVTNTENNTVSISGSGGTVEVTLNGTTTTFNAADVEEIEVVLGSGNDIVMTSAGVTAPMTIDGGAGNDLLVGGGGDDLLIGGTGNDVLVAGAGDNILLGGDGNDDLIGGSGNNVLVGGEGSDIALGGLGRDVIIGSQDSDLLSGGSGDDILIGGHTIHDSDVDALDAIMAIWGSSVSFNSRVATLTGAGGMLQAGSAVFDDDELDVILGGAGRDLIFADTNPWDGAFDLVSLQAAQDRLIAVN